MKGKIRSYRKWICINIRCNQFSLFLAMQQVCIRCMVGYFLIHCFFQMCVSMCAPSSSECSRGSRCLFHIALETEFIGTQVLLDHLYIHTQTSTVHMLACSNNQSVCAWIEQQQMQKTSVWSRRQCCVVLKHLDTWGEVAALRLHVERVTDSGWSWWEDIWDAMCTLSFPVTALHTRAHLHVVTLP